MTVGPAFRRQVRLAALPLMQALTSSTGLQVFSPGAFESAPNDMPGAWVRTSRDRKQSIGPNGANFGGNTVCTLEIVVRVAAATDIAAQDSLESWAAIIEATILGANALGVLPIEQFPEVRSDMKVEEEGDQFYGTYFVEFDLKTYEEFDSIALGPVLPDLELVAIHLDSINRYDPTGTYPNPPFPQAVTPAPRTQGPDGRDEAAALITTTEIDPD